MPQHCTNVVLLIYRIESLLYIFGKNLGIYLRGLDVGVRQHLANHLDAYTGMECLRGKCMASHVRC